MRDGGLRTIFREKLRAVHWQALETGFTGRGVPDSNGCYRGVEFWVEFKQTQSWTLGENIRPEQIAWHGRRARAGGRTFIAVRRKVAAGVRREAADEIWLYRGTAAAALVTQRLDKFDSSQGLVLRDTGGPSQWCWRLILVSLTAPVPQTNFGVKI